MKRTNIALLLLLAGLNRQACAQVARFPFDFNGKEIFIKLSVQGSPPMDFIFDTGTAGSSSIDSATAEKIGISKANRQLVTVAGHGSARQYQIAAGLNAALPGLELKGLNMTLINFDAFSGSAGFKLNGLIGDDIMNRYVTAVDFDQKEIKLYDQIGQVDTTGYTGVAFDYYKGVNIPRFPMTITLASGEKLTGKVMFDTGNGTTLLVSTPFSLFHDLEHQLGATVIAGGRGVSAATVDRLALISQASLGGFDFGRMMIKLTVNPEAKPADGYLGILGIDIIKRFNLILDYAHKKIYMKPNSLHREAFDLAEYDRLIAPVLAADTFLKANQTRPGVKTTASGLQYWVVRQGKGPLPAAGDKVKLYYTAKLPDGKVVSGPFDASKPFSHHLDKALPGIREAVLMMPVGSKYELYIPAALGFGEAGYGDVPAGAVLICELEVAGIEK
ncbi:FKBP-type peptidyl-prolyl cis-trans isomerase [Mucilaginibacter sp. UR6-11]|uniref:FKBP-type peptidyl-prolyl cis-trans isomerase n=1 Tax=Mucilaginibacter sp. UR6-11 TaxID=1435644 RepID=UPI001E570FDE|nr:FKBP-type peptidyl-prolyl cis-trans isomerase [Mucilaginibacter sp. UR6-11]MCC8423605.1 FKBP-type peptidyl-prolyl cis-trans isomerase [Mucilaginibacter sp. UR6-11]